MATIPLQTVLATAGRRLLLPALLGFWCPDGHGCCSGSDVCPLCNKALLVEWCTSFVGRYGKED